MKKISLTLLASFAITTGLSAHCQMPCGIYHDKMVFNGLMEDVQTLEKGISVLTETSMDTIEGHNKATRWIVLKEQVCDNVASVVVKHFLQQRVKGNEENLDQKLRNAHQILVLSMKVKQNVDGGLVKELGEAIHSFQHLMVPDAEHQH